MKGHTSPGQNPAARTRECLLARAFVRLADTLADDFDMGEYLHGLCVDSVQLLGAEAAAVMLADQGRGLRLVASSYERTQAMELMEPDSGAGPWLDAVSSGRVVQASAADARNRWPALDAYASKAGFQRLCALPLRAGGEVIGALNLFYASGEPRTGTGMEIAQAMAEVTTIALIQDRALRESTVLVDQLRTALNSRVVIEQAKGMLATRLTTSLDDAFHLMRSYARQNNHRLGEVAADIVNEKIASLDLTA